MDNLQPKRRTAHSHRRRFLALLVLLGSVLPVAASPLAQAEDQTWRDGWCKEGEKAFAVVVDMSKVPVDKRADFVGPKWGAHIKDGWMVRCSTDLSIGDPTSYNIMQWWDFTKAVGVPSQIDLGTGVYTLAGVVTDDFGEHTYVASAFWIQPASAMPGGNKTLPKLWPPAGTKLIGEERHPTTWEGHGMPSNKPLPFQPVAGGIAYISVAEMSCSSTPENDLAGNIAICLGEDANSDAKKPQYATEAPAPAPDPAPEPGPAPAPDPAPQPGPAPAPEPGPAPAPDPAPQPGPAPDPVPQPGPAPKPTGEPSKPAEQNKQTPTPTPTPSASPSSTPTAPTPTMTEQVASPSPSAPTTSAVWGSDRNYEPEQNSTEQGFPWLWVGIGAGVVALGAGLAWWFLLGRKRHDDDSLDA